MFIKQDSYKIPGKYGYPDPQVNPEEKRTQEWLYSFANAFWSEFVQGRLCNPYFEYADGDENNFDELRDYAQGKQSMEPLKEILIGKKNGNGKRTTKMNISWRGMDFMAKQFDVMRSMNQEVDFDVDVSCTDTDALNEREFTREYVKFLIEKNTREFVERMEFKPKTQGLDPNVLALKTASQVDLFIDAGGFPLQKEIKLQAAIEKSLDLSTFPVIKDMIFDDLIALAKSGCKTEINNATGETVPRYVDMKYALMPKSKYLDYRNMNRAGEVRFMTIAEIKEENPDISDTKLLQLARDYAYMNPEYDRIMGAAGFFNNRYRLEYIDQYGVDPMMTCIVMVLDAQFLSPDYEKYAKTMRNDTNNAVFYQVPNDFNPDKWTNNNMDKPEIKNSRCFRKYEFKWVVGTDIFLSGGLAKDVIYDGPDGNLKPKLDFRFYRTGNKSIIQRCKGHIDDMNLANLKKRNALKTLPPAPRMIINELLLSNVMLNGILQQPEDLIRTLEEKGFLVVKTLDDFQRNMVNGKMVDFIPSGIIEDLQLFTGEIETQKNNIREVTGVNQVADASNPNPEDGLGKAKIAISQTDHALFPTFRGFKFIFEGTCTDLAEKWQMLAKKKERILSHKPAGQSSTKALVLGSDIALSKFNIKVRLKSSEEDKRQLLSEISGLKQQRRANGGFGGISGAQYLFLYDRIMGGQVKLAMYMLAQMEQEQLEADNAAKNQSQNIAAKNAMAQAEQNSKNIIEQNSQKEKEQRKTIIAQEAIDRGTKIIDNVLRQQSVEGAPQIFGPDEIRAMLTASDRLLMSVIPTEQENAQLAQQQQAQAQQQEGGPAAEEQGEGMQPESAETEEPAESMATQ